MVKSEISVIITFYNEKDYQVRRSINSVLNQTYQDFELFCILDNPANEEIYGIIKDFESKDNRVKSIKLERNMGVSSARNIGVELSNSKFVTFLDGDDEFLFNSLQKQLEFMNDNTQLDLSGSLLIWKDEENEKNRTCYGCRFCCWFFCFSASSEYRMCIRPLRKSRRLI